MKRALLASCRDVWLLSDSSLEWVPYRRSISSGEPHLPISKMALKPLGQV
jgi:hypothetical protein